MNDVYVLIDTNEGSPVRNVRKAYGRSSKSTVKAYATERNAKLAANGLDGVSIVRYVPAEQSI